MKVVKDDLASYTYLPPASEGWNGYFFHRRVSVHGKYSMVCGPRSFLGEEGYPSPVTGPVQSPVLGPARGRGVPHVTGPT